MQLISLKKEVSAHFQPLAQKGLNVKQSQKDIEALDKKLE